MATSGPAVASLGVGLVPILTDVIHSNELRGSDLAFSPQMGMKANGARSKKQEVREID